LSCSTTSSMPGWYLQAVQLQVEAGGRGRGGWGRLVGAGMMVVREYACVGRQHTAATQLPPDCRQQQGQQEAAAGAAGSSSSRLTAWAT
jgi:molybdenum-dependent DNA-binding transcriptional regulator ModE